ncbi:MAG: rubrerythrin family protein [Gammaproteobacteria bacterium]|nr:MAG: rubrerythrin family protein [Gammaproteobacteria bacterium]
MNNRHPLCDQARDFFQGEMNDHITYRVLAERTRNARLRTLLQRIAAVELRHAGFWKALLEQNGEPVPEVRPRQVRLWFLGLLMRLVNPLLVISALELGEAAAYETYYRVWKEADLGDEERETLRGIIVDELEHESSFQREKEAGGFSNIRDFILGMNDGLVEILGAVTGLSAAYPGNPLVVAISGLIVGVAGALSMGIGAFISVRSQRQVNEAQQDRMQILFSVSPDRAEAEFRERLVNNGLPEDISDEISHKLGNNPETLASLLIEKSDENEWRSAFFTGGAYLFGVAFPVLPYFLADNSRHALIGSVLFAGLALTSVGTLISVLSGINLRTKVLEMVGSGLAAAGLAYLFGRLIQVLFGVEI